MSDEQPSVESPRRRLPIDLSDFELALDESPGTATWYLDLETGKLVRIDDDANGELERIYESSDSLEDIGPDGLRALLDASDLPQWQREVLMEADEVDRGLGHRFIAVPERDSHDSYRDMEDFVETVQSVRFRDSLYRAIEGRGAFGRFRDRLLDEPQERERWFDFKRQRLLARAREWLESEGIEPIPQSHGPSSP